MKKILTILLTLLLMIACIPQPPQTAYWMQVLDNDMGEKYEGSAQLTGWIIYEPYYGNAPDEPHFHVLNVENLPVEITGRLPGKSYLQNYAINRGEELDPRILMQLETYSEENPATIMVDEIELPSEGSPILSLIEILN